MVDKAPPSELDTRFSSAGATPPTWTRVRQHLADAEVSWLSTVRPDGRPHVTPVMSVWIDDAAYFCTGPSERKAHNLVQNPYCVLTTGCNALNEGLDLVVEGGAMRIRDDARLRRIAQAYESKYGSDWHYDVRDGAFQHEAGEAVVYGVVPVKVLGFGKGEFSQTRWRFDVPEPTDVS